MKKQISTREFARLAADNNAIVFRAPYCTAQRLLTFADAEYYNAGVYGWNCEFHLLRPADFRTNAPAVWICTGYRNLTGARIPDLGIWEEEARYLPFDKLSDYIDQFADYLIDLYEQEGNNQ